MSLTDFNAVIAQLKKSDVPAHLHYGIASWIDYGQIPGGFLEAIIRNDLCEAVARGDEESLVALPTM